MRGDVSAEPAAIGFSLGGVARWGANASVVAPLRCFLVPCPTQGRLANRANLQPNRRLPADGGTAPKIRVNPDVADAAHQAGSAGDCFPTHASKTCPSTT